MRANPFQTLPKSWRGRKTSRLTFWGWHYPDAKVRQRHYKRYTTTGQFLGGGHGDLLQYSFWDNSVNIEAWWATVCGVTKSWTWLSYWLHILKVISLVNIDVKILNKMLASQIQQYIKWIVQCEQWDLSLGYKNGSMLKKISMIYHIKRRKDKNYTT